MATPSSKPDDSPPKPAAQPDDSPPKPAAQPDDSLPKPADESSRESQPEKPKPLEKEPEGSPGNEENKKTPEELLKEIQMRKTHHLYCPNCTFNITETTKISKKGEEKFPYKNEGFVLSLVIVVSFKYPFIYIPWFYNDTPEPTQSVATKTPKKHVPGWLRFVLVVVLLLLSAIVLWVPPSPPPPPPPPRVTPASIHGVTPRANESLPVAIPDPRKSPEEFTEIDGILIPRGPDVVVEDNNPIMPSTLPNGPDAVSEDNKPYMPSPSPSPPSIKKKGGWITLSWVKYLPSNRVLAVISFLFLAILAMFWPSIRPTKRTEPEHVVPKEDLPDPTQNQNTGVPNSTSKPEDKKEKEDTAVEQGVASQNNDPSTPVNSKIVSWKKIGISLLPPKLPKLKLPEMLWKYFVVPELDILKSIVYGGLIESITSFGVVSSAAASGTSTLNVMALGIANLFSGLFLIIYNLYGLIMSEPFYPSADIHHMPDVKATDPYEELLGKRKKVILHCFVVVVSFVFFGVIPPLFYGFSFKITGKGHYEEAAVVVAASLVCVISLSFAKAYAFGINRTKTVAVYTGIAIGASAFSFIASQHLRDLFEKHAAAHLKV